MPNNLPFLTQVAVGRRPHLTIFGRDNDTPDGTGVRDYVHVMDLAAGHLRALEALELQNQMTIKLGTGRGTSVLVWFMRFRPLRQAKSRPSCSSTRRRPPAATPFPTSLDSLWLARHARS